MQGNDDGLRFGHFQPVIHTCRLGTMPIYEGPEIDQAEQKPLHVFNSVLDARSGVAAVLPVGLPGYPTSLLARNAAKLYTINCMICV